MKIPFWLGLPPKAEAKRNFPEQARPQEAGEASQRTTRHSKHSAMVKETAAGREEVFEFEEK